MSDMIPSKNWLGSIPVIGVNHVHILVKDIESVRKAYEGSPLETTFYDVSAFNGELAFMVHSEPYSVEYIQVIDTQTGAARLLKDAPLGLNAIDLLVNDIDESIEAARKIGFILTGRMVIYGCQEAWLWNPERELNIEFMSMPPEGYTPGSDPEADKAKVHIYGMDGTEDLYFE